MSWQPIEIAPKDGEYILVYNSYGTTEVVWLTEEMSDVPFDGFYIDAMKAGYFPLRGDEPAYWHPLPAPPVKEDAP